MNADNKKMWCAIRSGVLAAVAFAVVGCASTESMTAADAVNHQSPRAHATAPPYATAPHGVLYLQLNGQGAPGDDEFVPPEIARYFSILRTELAATGLFRDVRIWNESVPRTQLVLDAQIEAEIDQERSSSKTAFLLIVPVKTTGVVGSRFLIKRAGRRLAEFEYQEAVATRIAPVAELGGRTWVEKSGALPRMVQRLARDIETRSAMLESPVATVAAR
jgi:hypothetical protein